MNKDQKLRDLRALIEKTKEEFTKFHSEMIIGVPDQRVTKDEIEDLEKQINSLINVFNAMTNYLFIFRNFKQNTMGIPIYKLLNPQSPDHNKNFMLYTLIRLPNEKEEYMLVQYRYKAETVSDDGGIVEKSNKVHFKYYVYKIVYTENNIPRNETVIYEFTDYYECLANLIKDVHDRLMGTNDSEEVADPEWEQN